MARIGIVTLIMYILLILILLATSVGLSATPSQCKNIEIIEKTARKEGVDPHLAIAIAFVESSLKTNAKGALGEVGLFQLRPEMHRVSYSPNKDVSTAIKYLKKYEVKCRVKHGKAWFICHNLGPYRQVKNPKKTKYYQKVMGALDEQNRGYWTLTGLRRRCGNQNPVSSR